MKLKNRLSIICSRNPLADYLLCSWSLASTNTFALFCAFCCSICPAQAHPLQPINSIIGDQSFIYMYGEEPNLSTNENLRIFTHLAYVEDLLRRKDVSHLSASQKEKRTTLLDLLHDYNRAGIFPRNYDHPEERKPCFIDRKGRICAVGYLVEQSAGRQAAEQINETFQYARIMDMNSPEVESWIASSGLSKEECAMIQPEYSPQQQPIITPTYNWVYPSFQILPDYKKQLDSQKVLVKKLTHNLDSLSGVLDSISLVAADRELQIDSLNYAVNSSGRQISSLRSEYENRKGQMYGLIIGLGILALGSLMFIYLKLRPQKPSLVQT